MASQTSQPLIVLVVGASSGIGEATAKAFAARGHKVYGTSRDRKRVKLGNVDALSLDVFDETSMIKAAFLALFEWLKLFYPICENKNLAA